MGLEILDVAWAIARESGLAAVTLREVADRVGMRAPSLYTHFDSKNAIYDAMFGQAWTECLAVCQAALEDESTDARAALRRGARTFFDFAVSDLPRHQLMNLRTIPGFEPSPAAYAPNGPSRTSPPPLRAARVLARSTVGPRAAPMRRRTHHPFPRSPGFLGA